MTDSTWIGVAGIVAIVVVSALFFGLQDSTGVSVTGASVSQAPQASTQAECTAGRFCDGSKLVIVRADCSIAESFCQRGCNTQALVCN